MTLRISDKIPKGRLSYEHKVISQNEENHTAGNNCHLILNLRTFFPLSHPLVVIKLEMNMVAMTIYFT